MKLTKKYLKQLIKEELDGERTGAYSDIGGAYDVLPRELVQGITDAIKKVSDHKDSIASWNRSTVDYQMRQLFKKEIQQMIDDLFGENK